MLLNVLSRLAFTLFVFRVSRDSCVDLPHDGTVCLQFVIVVFPDQTHYFAGKVRVVCFAPFIVCEM